MNLNSNSYTSMPLVKENWKGLDQLNHNRIPREKGYSKMRGASLAPPNSFYQ
jgi:hypothetical protein